MGGLLNECIILAQKKYTIKVNKLLLVDPCFSKANGKACNLSLLSYTMLFVWLSS